MKKLVVLAVPFMVLSGCQTHTPESRKWIQAVDIAFPMQAKEVVTSYFNIRAFTGIRSGLPLEVFVETETNSFAPGVTPQLVAARRAFSRGRSVLYLATPCQYVRDAHCKRPGWLESSSKTGHSEAIDEAITNVKKSFELRDHKIVETGRLATTMY